MELSDTIKKLRNEKGWTQARLAEEICVDESTIGKWEYKLRQNIYFECIIKLSDAFDVSADVFRPDATEFNLPNPHFGKKDASQEDPDLLVKGVPLQRTEVSRDPAFPITESNIVNLLKNQISAEKSDIVDIITLDTVMKGAGPILTKVNDLISKGKKLIVADAVSTTDLEQLALAITKSNYKILPCGSAGGRISS